MLPSFRPGSGAYGLPYALPQVAAASSSQDSSRTSIQLDEFAQSDRFDTYNLTTTTSTRSASLSEDDNSFKLQDQGKTEREQREWEEMARIESHSRMFITLQIARRLAHRIQTNNYTFRKA